MSAAAAITWQGVKGACLALPVLIAAVLAGAMIGETALAPDLVLSVLANKLAGAGLPVDPIDQGIVWSYRLPRALVAGACGASLAVAGVVLQALLRNALADPYILGISAGASTGAVAVTIAGLGGGALSLSFGAFNGALLAFGFVAVLARAAGAGGSRAAAAQIVLAGIAGSQLFNALTAFIIAKSANADQARGIMFWLMGNMGGVRWPDVWLAVPLALAGWSKATWFSVVPTIISHLLHSELDPVDSTRTRLRFGRSASSALAPDVQRAFEDRFGIPIIETMGLTETAAQILSNPLPPGTRKIGSPGVGYGNGIAILDANQQPVTNGTEGELAVRGPNVMLEY
ncbi:iron chelate uptake ABC transporter family permease subunit, partial [Leisingera sp. F5]|uniref:iron chelate uptake ABC transporter family permease subunit n=1 Tax=Leisingera sp. F5 TaxID=1813816 RepID=UPI000AE4DD14